jgi:hypothetical protein
MRRGIVLWLMAAVQGAEAQSSALAGAVRDAAGRPVALVAVVADSGRQSVVTDDSGRFHIAGLRPGRNDVSITRAGFRALEFVAELPRDSTVVVAIRLQAEATPLVSLTGVVVDSAGRPIPDVEVALKDVGRTVFTDPSGLFQITGVTSGSHVLSARRIGWAPLDTIVGLEADVELQRVVLRRVPTLETVESRATANLADFDDNRRVGLGHFFTAADIEREKPRFVSELLLNVSGLRLIRDRNGMNMYVVTSRGPRTLTGQNCGAGRYADVYVDGVRLYRGRRGDQPFNINSINPDIISGIEYYASPAQTPAKYQNLDTICGVIVIWTRR